MNIANWRKPEILLMLMSSASGLSFAVWSTLINNFAVERANFSGYDMGVLQSVREIPGFLAFAVVFVLLVIKEQRLAYVSLAMLGVFTAATGFFNDLVTLSIITFLMSIGFHYFETLQSSLSLQWLEKSEAPAALGRILAVGSFVSIISFALIWLLRDRLALDLTWLFVVGGVSTLVLTALAARLFPRYPEKVVQHKHMVLRKRYWLYYALVFMSGARRQIFVVFAGFLMVEKFGYDVSAIAMLFLINGVINVFLAPKIGRWIGKWGERKALIFEYVGLIGVFLAYAVVDDSRVAAGLYILDHMFFALAIAIKTYFQKIADPKDIAATAGVGFTISHIAAVFFAGAVGRRMVGVSRVSVRCRKRFGGDLVTARVKCSKRPPTRPRGVARALGRCTRAER